MKGHKQIGPYLTPRTLDRLEELVIEICGFEPSTNRYRDTEIVRAIRTFIDQDRGAGVEDRLAAHDEALADNLGHYSRRRKSWEDPLVAEDLHSDDKERIRPSVPEPLYTELKEYVDGLDVNMSYSEAIERALREHLDGGRKQRVADRLEDMTAAVESSDGTAPEPAQSDDESDESDDEDTRPYRKEDKLEAIESDLADANAKASAEEIEQLPRKQVVDAIHRYCSQEPDEPASDRTVDTYLGIIKDRLDLALDPKNGVLLVKESSLDGLAFELKDYDDLSSEDKLEAIHVQLLRDADENSRYQVSAAHIRDNYLDGRPDDPTAHGLRKKAARMDGFEDREVRGEKKLRVAPSDVPDELREKAGLATQDDEDDIRAAAEAELAELDQATAARTDGGRNMPRGDG